MKLLSITDQMLVSGSHFLIGIIVARALGLAGFGIFAVAWMVVLFANSLQQAFILTPMMTFAPQKEKTAKKDYLSDLWILQIGVALIAMSVTFAFCWSSQFFSPEWNLISLTKVLPLTIFLFLIHDFLRKQFYVNENLKAALALDFLAYTPQLIFLAFSYMTNTLVLAKSLWFINAGYLIAILFNMRHTTGIDSSSTKTLKRTCSQHWQFAKWLVGKTLLQWFSGNLFIITAATLLGPAAVGAIRLAQNVMGIVNVFFIAIENYIPIQAAKIYAQQGKIALFNYLKTITLQGGILSTILVAAILLLAPLIIKILYGITDPSSILLLRGFAILSLIVFIGIPIRFAIRTLEQTKSIFIAYTLSTTFSFTCAYPIVKNWGLTGVIIGLITAQAIMQIYYLLNLKTLQNSEKTIEKKIELVN